MCRQWVVVGVGVVVVLFLLADFVIVRQFGVVLVVQLCAWERVLSAGSLLNGEKQCH